MGQPIGSRQAMTDAQRTQVIRTEVQAAAARLRDRHTWLDHQDAIGLFIQLGSVAGMVACTLLYLQGAMPWWLTVPLVAILAAFTHEMEHDLIHQLYFKKSKPMQDFLLLLGWIARPSTINPWARRDFHFHHHKVSGTRSDLEERSITNGEVWGVRRLLMLVDSMLAVMLRPATVARYSALYIRDAEQPRTRREIRRAIVHKMSLYMPLGHVCWGLWHAFVLFHSVNLGAQALGQPVAWPQWVLDTMVWVNAATVCWVGPNVLRTFCLHFVSSNMHYYGDVEKGNVMQQCQVWTHPVFWPVQLFCFNFGSTHAIHHFVVGQPFYVRQMIASEAHDVMRRMGVRFNDFGSFRRANRWGEHNPAAERAAARQARAAQALKASVAR
jgi:fatty acid desaturase